MAAASAKAASRRRISLLAVLDEFFFVFAGVSAVWLAWLLLSESFTLGWWGILMLVLFWGLLAYLVLPRIHLVLTTIYVPDYFIGRTRTSDGLLGDPVNLALMGDKDQVHAAMRGAGWTLADPVTLRSSLRIVTSTLTRRSYHEAPVSPLFLFGRIQDFAYQQEVAGNPAKRHHVRFWRTPEGWLLPGGARVDWLAAGTFDRAVGLSLFALQVTPKIDATSSWTRCCGRPRRRSCRCSRISPRATTHATAAATASAPTGICRSSICARSPSHRRRCAMTERQRLHRKRPAVEPAGALLGRETADGRDATGVGAKRPGSIALGSALVLGRALASALWLVGFSFVWPETARGLRLDSGDATIVFWFVAAINCAAVVVLALFAWLIWRGSNAVRVVTMCVLTISILGSAAGYFAAGEEITVQTTLLTVALDILILLALSSRDARVWARRDRLSRGNRSDPRRGPGDG